MRKRIAGLLTAAAIVVGGVAVSTPASAAPNDGCGTAIGFNKQVACTAAHQKSWSVHTLGTSRIGSAQVTFCTDKSNYGTVLAYKWIRSIYGNTRGSALAYGADTWLC